MQQDPKLVWRKSSYSSGNGQCIEVSESLPGLIPVRDSKDPAGSRLVFEADTWMSFVSAVQAGDF